MKKKTKKKNKKGLLFRIVKNGFKKKLDKFEIIGSENIPDEPSLIIGNHAQMHGPIFAEVNFPYNRTTWCMGCMHHLKEIPPYIIDDFWPYKKKGTVWFYKFLSWLLAPLCHYIFTNADTIGVYKDARGITTFKNSILALEEEKHINRILHLIKDNDIKTGIALNPHTSQDSLEYILRYIDFVLLMSVNPGFGGQNFISSTLEKAIRLKEMIKDGNFACKISMDGGINNQNINMLKEAGVDIAIAGNYIFKSQNYQEAINLLR